VSITGLKRELSNKDAISFGVRLKTVGDEISRSLGYGDP
jgi:hypothetical protein